MEKQKTKPNTTKARIRQSKDMYYKRCTTTKCTTPTHTTPHATFYGPFSRTTRVSRCQRRTSGLYGARED